MSRQGSPRKEGCIASELNKERLKLRGPWAFLMTVTAPLWCSLLLPLDTCMRVSSPNFWIPPSVFANRSPGTKQIAACVVLFLWLQTSHRFWSPSTVNLHILHRMLWPSHSALHHLVRLLEQIQGLGFMTQYFFPGLFILGTVWGWHIGTGVVHPAQSHGHPLTLKQIRLPILWITCWESMWEKIDLSVSLRIHANHKAHIHTNCFLKTKPVKTEAIKVCESSTQTSSLQAHMTPRSFPDALPSQIMEAADILLEKGLSDSTGS